MPLCRFLLGADVDKRTLAARTDKGGMTPLRLAASTGNVSMCTLLLEHGAGAFSQGLTKPACVKSFC